MNTAFLHKNNIASTIDLKSLKLNKDLERMLFFLSEICSCENLFVSLVGAKGHFIEFKIGLDFLTSPHQINCFQELVDNNNKLLLVSKFKRDSNYQIIKGNTSFNFFAGFPINIPGSIIPGALCILNEDSKEFSSIELKTINYTISQIESLLQLHLDNQILQDMLFQKENNFHLLIKNSKEVFYQFDLNGNVTYVSKNWSNLLGYSNDDILGNHYNKYIHPDDLESCSNFLYNILEKTNKTGEHTYRIKHNKGQYLWFSCKIEFAVNSKGSFYIGASREITDYVEAQNKLIEQKIFYEKIINGLPTGVAVYDSHFRYIYLNPNAIKNEKLRKFIIGKNDFEYAEKTNREELFAINRKIKYDEAIEKKQTIEWEEILYDKLGQKTYHTRKLTPLFHNDGTVDILIGFGVDITESINAQLEILKSKQLTSNVISNAGVGILVQGPESEIFENNDAACLMLGLTQDQLHGKTSFNEEWSVIHVDGTIFKAEDHPVPQAIKQLVPLHNIIMGVHRPVTNDFVWLLVNAIPVFGENKELIYVICSFSDITILKTTQDELKKSNERFEYARKATSDLMWDWDLTTDVIFFGGMGATQFGTEFENKTLMLSESTQFIHPDDRDYVLNSLKKAFEESKSVWKGEYRFLRSDGSYANVKNSAIIIRDENGQPIRLIGASQDITYEKKLQKELIQSEDQFKGAFLNSPVGMAIVNLDGYFMVVNNQMIEIFGYTLEEFKTLKFSDLTHPDDVEVDLANLEFFALELISIPSREKKYLHKNGTIVWVYLSVSLIKNSIGKPVHFISQLVDITRKKEVEYENKLLVEENSNNNYIQLNEAKNMYRLLADNMIDLVCLHTLDSSFQYVSPSIRSILGYYPEDLIGLSPLDFIHPNDKEKLHNSILSFITEKEYLVAQLRFRNKNGIYIWCETTAKLVKEKGRVTSFHSATRDITQRMVADTKMEKALHKERKLNELKSNLVSTISHEFRTPMTTIRASAELIQMYLENQKIKNESLLHKRINTIIGEIDRLVELMNTVLVISKNDLGKTNFNPVNFDLKQICFDVLELCDTDQKKGINLITSFKGDTFPVYADIKLMEYTLINLLNNAFKYSQGLGDVLFNIFEMENSIIIEIKDFGIGIPDEDQDKLFNTFFRASNTNGIPGTGLGLYIVKVFTERNLGSIKLESKLTKGTKVTLNFPKVSK